MLDPIGLVSSRPANSHFLQMYPFGPPAFGPFFLIDFIFSSFYTLPVTKCKFLSFIIQPELRHHVAGHWFRFRELDPDSCFASIFAFPKFAWVLSLLCLGSDSRVVRAEYPVLATRSIFVESDHRLVPAPCQFDPTWIRSPFASDPRQAWAVTGRRSVPVGVRKDDYPGHIWDLQIYPPSTL